MCVGGSRFALLIRCYKNLKEEGKKNNFITTMPAPDDGGDGDFDEFIFPLGLAW